MAKVCMDLVGIIVIHLLCIDNIKFSTSVNSTDMVVSVGTTVVLDCKCDHAVSWNYETTRSLVQENILYERNFPGNITFFVNNKSFVINAVTVENEGAYQCKCNFNLTEEYYLTVEVPPVVFINIDHQNISTDTQYFEANTNHTVNCHAHGAKPAVELTWKKNGEVIPVSSVAFNTTETPYNSKLQDSVASLWIQLKEECGQLTCTATSLNRSKKYEWQVFFLTYVTPTVSLEVNGQKAPATKNFYSNIDEKVSVVCRAKGARPDAYVSLFINGEMLPASSLSNREDIFKGIRVNNTSFYGEFRFRQIPTEIICYGRGSYGYHDINATATVYKYDSPTLTLSINGTSVVNGTKYLNKEDDSLKITCRSNGAAAQRVILKWDVTGNYETYYNVSEINVKGTNNSSFYKEETIIIKLRKGKSIINCTGSCFNCREQSHCVEVETVGPSHGQWVAITVSTVLAVVLLYSVIKVRESLMALFPATPSEDPVETIEEDEKSENIELNDIPFKRADLTLLSRLPGEGVFRYWKAMTSISNEEDKFVAKSVSEFAQLKDLYNFRDGAKQLLTLPKHKNIVDTIGIAIEDVPYYVYQEYVECGTLRDYILRNYQKKRDSQILSRGSSDEKKVEKRSKVSLTAFSLDVCEAMSFLADHNFRHPALHSCKVLLTKTITCKLYDFVHEDNADDRIQYMLQKINAPIAWLPPETIFFRQYSAQADVWSLAVLLWEIYSLGDTPYAGLKRDDIEKKIRNGTCLLQPIHCPGGIFGTMLASWDISPEKRPVFKDIADSLKKILLSLKEQQSDSGDDTGLAIDPTYFTLEESQGHNDYEDGDFKSFL